MTTSCNIYSKANLAVKNLAIGVSQFVDGVTSPTHAVMISNYRTRNWPTSKGGFINNLPLYDRKSTISVAKHIMEHVHVVKNFIATGVSQSRQDEICRKLECTVPFPPKLLSVCASVNNLSYLY